MKTESEACKRDLSVSQRCYCNYCLLASDAVLLGA